MCSTVTGKQHFPERGLHIAVIGKIKGIHFKDNWYFLMHKPYREQVVKVILCFLSSVSTPIVCVCVCYWSLDTSNAVTSPIILSYWVFWKMLFMLFFCNVTHPHTIFSHIPLLATALKIVFIQVSPIRLWSDFRF